MTWQIRDLTAADLEATAALLHAGFLHLGEFGWPTLELAREEVTEALDPERINRIAVTAAGEVVGWVGGIPAYHGHAWELHPLVVAPAQQRQGIGRALARDFEQRVAARGGLTIFLGTDDPLQQTTLGGVELYPDVLLKAATIRNLRGHPVTFYQRMGYVVVGVLPDVNGLGKPDIFMAKRVMA
jgi:aminoglycoside 6'-N-acetyltransferase I